MIIVLALMGCSGRDFVQIVAGSDHTCGLHADGSVSCWGLNHVGQLGDGLEFHMECSGAPSDCSPSPVWVAGLDDVRELAVGTWHTCAIRSDASLWCWGYNGGGQLGDGTNLDRSRPVRAPLDDVVAVAPGFEHTCALTADGVIWCWGSNRRGELGDGTLESRYQPQRILLSQRATAVVGGAGYVCASMITDQVWCWGGNSQGALGDGIAMHGDCFPSLDGWQDCSPTPVRALTPAPIERIFGGNGTTCAVSSGDLTCWGGNSEDLPPLDSVRMYAFGTDYTCAIVNGDVSCWGLNLWGVLGGPGPPYASDAPVPVSLPGPAVHVAASSRYSCAVLDDGSAWCWGSSAAGALGDGTLHTRPTPPVQVVAP